MTGDWLDRAALAADERVSRRGVLKLAAASALVLGPLGTLLRASEARGATARAADDYDCVNCTLTTDAENAALRKDCAAIVATSVTVGPLLPGGAYGAFGASVACLTIVFTDWYDGYDNCRAACKPSPRLPYNPWVYLAPRPPRQKAPPPKKKPPTKKPPTKKTPTKKPPPKPNPCGTCSAYCSPCASNSTGFICCIYPPKDGKSPCCA